MSITHCINKGRMRNFFTQRKEKRYIVQYPDGILTSVFATSKDEVRRKLRKVKKYSKNIKIKQDKTYAQ